VYPISCLSLPPPFPFVPFALPFTQDGDDGGCAQPIQVQAKAPKSTTVKPGRVVRYTLHLMPEDAAAWTDVDLAVTLSPYLTLRKATVSPRVKPYVKPATTSGSGGTTVVTFDDLQRPKARANKSSSMKHRPVKVTITAQVSKTAPAGALPGAITAALCSGPVASLDVRVCV
jgi:hypothetical protein